MSQHARSLALRDPARAGLLGILAPVVAVAGVAGGVTSFGAEGRPSYAPKFGRDVAGGFMPSQFGGHTAQFGYTAGFGGTQVQTSAPTDASGSAIAAPNPNNPAHHQALMQAWHAQNHAVAKTNERLSLLSPNNGSSVDVEAYVFSVNPNSFTTGSALSWGTANGWTAAKNPQTSFRAEMLKVNVNNPGIAYISAIQAANVNAQIGSLADAYTFSAISQGSRVSLPTLPPQNTMQVSGTWSNVTPVPFTQGQTFTLALDFLGWATVTA